MSEAKEILRSMTSIARIHAAERGELMISRLCDEAQEFCYNTDPFNIYLLSDGRVVADGFVEIIFDDEESFEESMVEWKHEMWDEEEEE
ncbi:hypothetical protein [Eubacterium sp.]|uniref:hypothetical protein n=1 Tax=Eubacterium sp. TaxID=142586 RepID=UPI002FC88B65